MCVYNIPWDIKRYIISLGFEQKESNWFEVSDKTKKFNYFLSISRDGSYRLLCTGIKPAERAVVFRGYKISGLQELKFLFGSVYVLPLMRSL